MLSTSELTFFRDNGYLILKGLLKEELTALQNSFFTLTTKFSSDTSTTESSDVLAQSVRHNQLLIDLYRKAPDTLVEIQRILSKSPEFAQVASHPPIISSIKQLMGLEVSSPLYMLSNCAVFEFPHSVQDKQSFNFHTTWHDDLFWTIPNSQFTHIWIPLLNPADKALGTLKICQGSHKSNWKGRHQFHPNADYNYRYTVKEDYVKQFTTQDIEVDVGDVLLFDQYLVHSSGQNITDDRVRVTMIGLFHDAMNQAMRPLTPALTFRDKTPEQWFAELYQDPAISSTIAKEQLDETVEPPTGI